MTTDVIKARIAELDKQISEYPYWGAFLTAANEERQHLKEWLAYRELHPETKP